MNSGMSDSVLAAKHTKTQAIAVLAANGSDVVSGDLGADVSLSSPPAFRAGVTAAFPLHISKVLALRSEK